MSPRVVKRKFHELSKTFQTVLERKGYGRVGTFRDEAVPTRDYSVREWAGTAAAAAGEPFAGDTHPSAQGSAAAALRRATLVIQQCRMGNYEGPAEARLKPDTTYVGCVVFITYVVSVAYVVSAFRRTRSDRRPSVTPRITVRLKPDTADVNVLARILSDGSLRALRSLR